MGTLTGITPWKILFTLISVVLLVFVYTDINNKLRKIEELEHVVTESLATTIHNVNELNDRLNQIEKKTKRQNYSRNLNITYSKEFIKYTKLDMFCLAKNMYHEAKGEGKIGMIAVAQVTLNRLNNGTWGNTICDVVMARGQFSWTYNKALKWSHPKTKSWEEAKSLAEEVLVKGARLNYLQDALFYHAEYVKPKWASKNYLISQIGAHIFYRNAL